MSTGAPVVGSRSRGRRSSARAGDPEAFAELYATHEQELFRYCRSILRHEEDAHDALQNTMVKALRALPGVKTWDSDANMVLVRVPDATRAFEGMRERGVLVKNVSKMHPLLANCLRLTVGTADENAQMLAALDKSL